MDMLEARTLAAKYHHDSIAMGPLVFFTHYDANTVLVAMDEYTRTANTMHDFVESR